ncbi:MAG: DNA-3-methyladenine glycosylase 2 family protein [Actinomycetota bacterium]
MRRVLRPEHPLDLSCTLRTIRRGVSDPTMRLAGGEVLRATRTPEGPATVHFRRDGDRIEVEAWGEGGEWVLQRVPRLLGFDDLPERFRPRHAILRELHLRHPGLRFGATGAVAEAAVASVLEQKVTGREAWRAYRQLVQRYSEPAPGPHKLMLPPDPGVLAGLGYYDFHPFGVEKRRADTLLRVCKMAAKLNSLASHPADEAGAVLMRIPGIGPWTAAEVSRVALGDIDAVSIGDVHLPHLVSWNLAGEPRGDDGRMLELLEPYRGQRARAVRLLELSGNWAPRRGPRYNPIPIARL